MAGGRLTSSWVAQQQASRKRRSGALLAGVPAPALVGYEAGPTTQTWDVVLVTEDERPTAAGDDYQMALVPLQTAGVTSGALVYFTSPECAAGGFVAVFLITCLAMRNDDFSRLVAWFAAMLRPPGE